MASNLCTSTWNRVSTSTDRACRPTDISPDASTRSETVLRSFLEYFGFSECQPVCEGNFGTANGLTIGLEKRKPDGHHDDSSSNESSLEEESSALGQFGRKNNDYKRQPLIWIGPSAPIGSGLRAVLIVFRWTSTSIRQD